MLLLATRDSWWMTQCEAALLAEGVELRWIAAPLGDALLLEVPDHDAERAVSSLSELLGEELRRRAEPPLGRLEPLLLQPAFAFAVGFALLTLAFFWVTGPTARGGEWQQQGAFVVERALRGEWWRLLTAATLHADVAHALGNAGFFLLLGWAAGERLGPGVAALTWLATAVAGFAATPIFSEATLSVGASGGLFGLLGAAGGHALRHWRSAELQRRGRLRAVGGAVLLLSFTASSPRASLAAHLVGFAAGWLLGLLAPRLPARAPLQAAAGLVCGALVAAAWWVGLEAGRGS